MNSISRFRMDGQVEEMMDRFEKTMNETKRVNWVTNLEYALSLQFIDRHEKMARQIVMRSID